MDINITTIASTSLDISTPSSPCTQPVRPSKLLSLGGKKYVTIRKRCSSACVNIRTYSSDDCDFLSSTKRGIMLTVSEWNKLKESISVIDERLNARTQTLDSSTK